MEGAAGVWTSQAILNRMRFLLISLFLMAAFNSPVATASVGVSSLRGIDRIAIVIEDLNSDSTNSGVTEDALRSRIEFALKRVKINVVSSSDETGKNNLFVPILYLSLKTDRSDGFHEFVIHLELLQAVTLARDPKIKASSATTWSALRFARVRETDYANKVRTLLTIMLEGFLDDYLAANPK
jgi:hypothetical protein